MAHSVFFATFAIVIIVNKLYLEMEEEILPTKKVVVACDSYKGCLSSKNVNETIADALRQESKKCLGCHFDIVTLQMSDGGEGMLDAFIAAKGGERVKVHVHDPLMRWTDATYGIGKDGVAVIEVAQAVGLALVEPEQRNPMKATSWGVGELVMDAYRRGVREFIIGLGGSATSDCGIGMLRAMGEDWKKIREECHFRIASDVINPLLGPQGAAKVFAPQKGATEEMVEQIEYKAIKFAELSAKHFGYDRSKVPGAGAAGGLGYAFLQYFNAELRSGAEVLLEIVNFDRVIADADIVITGEGCSDEQTLMGKLPLHILQHTQKSERKPDVYLLSGRVVNSQAFECVGFKGVVGSTPVEMPLQKAMLPKVAKANIAQAVKELCLEDIC